MYDLTIAEAEGFPPLFTRRYEKVQHAMQDIIPWCIQFGGSYAEINRVDTCGCVLSAIVDVEAR